ncbi:hypothetical protein [Hymenobacter amundsenii]|uniref:hypothetical protein n=1 Tax=Hymenobacter amundsenii TaxID=2006685 RepID=UPI0013FDDF5C|nr:hypothetical protein [Hymenobacter amundsenii]
MLSTTPDLMIVHPDNAAQLAVRPLNRPRLREQLSQEIQQTKAKLRAADSKFRVM